MINTRETTDNILRGCECSKSEALALVQELDLEQLLEISGKINRKFNGRKFSLCGIMNIKSGACSENCRFCSQSAHYQGKVDVYDLLDQRLIVERAKKLAADKVEYFGVVSSGAAMSDKNLEALAEAIKAIRQCCDIKICASLGHLKVNQIKLLAAAGLSRYHHNFETSEKFYPSICTSHSWQDRFDTVTAAQASGIELCCGGLFGLGEDWEDRIDLALTLRELGVKNVPLNFLNPRAGTPLANREILSPEEALKIIAVYRIILPRAALRVCGGRLEVFSDNQKQLLDSGINALMTGDYLTTSGISPEADRKNITECGFEL